jgi:hypothetical protein
MDAAEAINPKSQHPNPKSVTTDYTDGTDIQNTVLPHASRDVGR